jgi:hypothetical protein
MTEEARGFPSAELVGLQFGAAHTGGAAVGKPDIAAEKGLGTRS